MSDATPNADIVAEASRLLAAAAAADVPVRLVGGLAVRAHLPDGTSPVISREYKDIDLVTLKGRSKAVTAFMTEQGYEADRVFNTTNGHRRLLYYD
ncbi:MAG TPA: nucleotidyltransferase family protein, partial [Gaiellales bacterium]